MKKIIEKIKKFRDDRNWKQFHTLDNLAKSISIEAAELLENFQWSSNPDINEVSDELADILIYCILLADTIDVKIEEIINKKLLKNEKKYPIEKAFGSSKKYNKL